MAENWSDYTDIMLTEVSSRLGQKYKVDLKKMLANPANYKGQANIWITFSNMKEDTNKILNDMTQEVKDQQQELIAAVTKADAITSQLSQNISMQAKQHNTPLIKPVQINRDGTGDETIFVDSVDPSILTFIDKMATNASYIADYSFMYKDRKIGSWLFSGEKSYMLTVYIPMNDAYLLDQSKEEINGLFDSAEVYFA